MEQICPKKNQNMVKLFKVHVFNCAVQYFTGEQGRRNTLSLTVPFLRKSSTDVANTVKKIAVAMENGEYDYDGTQEKVVSVVFQMYVKMKLFNSIFGRS